LFSWIVYCKVKQKCRRNTEKNDYFARNVARKFTDCNQILTDLPFMKRFFGKGMAIPPGSKGIF